MAKLQLGKIEFHKKPWVGEDNTAKLFMLENQIEKQGKQIKVILKELNKRKKRKHEK